MNCFGKLSRDDGQSRVPAPPHMMTGVMRLIISTREPTDHSTGCAPASLDSAGAETPREGCARGCWGSGEARQAGGAGVPNPAGGAQDGGAFSPKASLVK